MTANPPSILDTKSISGISACTATNAQMHANTHTTFLIIMITSRRPSLQVKQFTYSYYNPFVDNNCSNGRNVGSKLHISSAIQVVLKITGRLQLQLALDTFTVKIYTYFENVTGYNCRKYCKYSKSPKVAF